MSFGPLLDVSRADLRSYLAARGERWVEDETERRSREPAQPDPPRGAARARLRGRRPDPAAIARAAGLIREDGQWLDELATRRYRGAGRDESPRASKSKQQALLAEPPPVRRRVLLRALRAGAGEP